MTQDLVDLFNSRLPAYNTLLDEQISRTKNGAERRNLAERKFAPIAMGEVSDNELRRRLRMQRLRLGSVLKGRAIELLRHIEPGALHLHRYTVGLPYAEIIETLRQEFPEAQVSSACLRWYVSRLNEDARDLGMGDAGLPKYRPRSKDSSYQKWADAFYRKVEPGEQQKTKSLRCRPMFSNRRKRLSDPELCKAQS